MKFFKALCILMVLLQLISCGGGGNSSVAGNYTGQGTSSSTDISGVTIRDVSDCHASASGLSNVVPICVDSGPEPSSVGVVNQAFVTVQLCVPGSTNQCAVIDHIQVDTGSTGLRVAVKALASSMPLPAVTDNNGQAVAECYLFVSGWTWGSVNRADVYIGGMVARNVPIHLLGHSPSNPGLGGSGGGAFPQVPVACSSQASGGDMGSVAQLGANGILGLSSSDQDCEGCDADANNGQYFVCPSSVCRSSAMATSGQPGHLGLYLRDFPDGVIVSLPALSSASASFLQGTLTFGIGNIPATVHPFVLNDVGEFNVAFDGQTFSQGYIDSGSNALFFNPTASAIPVCSNDADFYCPSSALQISATNSDASGHSNTVTTTINNLNTVSSQNPHAFVIAGLAGPSSTGTGSASDPTFAWGFPFFIGRTVYVVRKGTPNGSTYGVVAYTP